MFNTSHLISILGYLGIGFISGAISHGFFSGTRSLIMAGIGIILFLTAEFLSGEKKNYIELFVYGLIYSIAVGMLSGGFQHFLDSPRRSLWIVPVGYFVSLMIYQLQHPDSNSNKIKTLIVGFLTAIALYGAFYGAMHVIPEIYFAEDHHSIETTTDKTTTMHHATITSEEQFIAEMIPHHQEAVDTATIIVAKGSNPELKKIAQAIIDGQSNEITMLQGWLTSRYPSSNYKASYQNMMRPLDKVSGHNLEDQFMEDMIHHHEGAIQMAKQVLEVSKKPEIIKFANDVIKAQSSEITAFKKLLDSKGRH